MKRFALGALAALALLFCAPAARAQIYVPVPSDSYGYCFALGAPGNQAISASCTVTVYDTGTTNPSTNLHDALGNPLASPFTAATNGTWKFFGPSGFGYDIRLSGGLPALIPYTITDVIAGATNLLASSNQWTADNCWKGPQPWLDVTCWGAKGDGSTDDGPAIQNAINAACSTGGSVRFPTPAHYYFIHTGLTINFATCDELHLVGAMGIPPPGGGISQFARAPRVPMSGDALPMFDFDNSSAGADAYVTLENLDFTDTAGMAVKTVGLPFFLMKNVGCGYDYNAMVTHSACVDMEGSTLWFKAEDSSFQTDNDNTGPFNPTPPKTYDPTSWAPAAFLVVGNDPMNGSILFNFDNDTWAFGGLKFSVEDNSMMSTGQTFGEIIFNMNVIEGQFAGPMLQFENNQSATGSGQTVTLARVTFIESQQADVAHPTPLMSLKGTTNHFANVSSVYFMHSLSHSECYVQGINGFESISGVWAENPLDLSYACDQFSVPVSGIIRHTGNGLDITATPAGPTQVALDAGNGTIRGFVPDGTHGDTLTASSMLDTDGSHYLGPGGTAAFDIQTHRAGSQEYSVAFPIAGPTSFADAVAAGGAVPAGTYYACIASGDRNNTPFTVSPCAGPAGAWPGSELGPIVVPGPPGNATINFTWTQAPTNTTGKNTIYIGTTAGGENKAQNCVCNGSFSMTTYPIPNQIPNTVGTLLSDAFQVNSSGFWHNFGTAFEGIFGATPTANRTWTFPDRTGAVCVSAGTCSVTQLTTTVATGTPPFVVSSVTPVANLTATNHPTVFQCGTVAACSPAQEGPSQIFIGTAALNNASPSLVTITGIAPAFTSSATYVCTVSDQTSSAHPFTVTYVSGASFTITTATNTITDTMSYSCAGY